MDLKKIVQHVESLASLPTEGIEPCHHVLESIHNVMRPDHVGPCLPRQIFLDNAPKQTSGFIQTPPIFKKGP